MSIQIEQSPLPSRHSVRSLIEALVGRDVKFRDALPLPIRDSNLLAVYVTDRMTVSAVAVVDLEAAARMGAALGMLPKAGVDDMIAEGGLTQLVRDNCYEVLNVMASVFNVPDAPHVRLHEFYGPGGSAPADVLSLSQVMGSRDDVAMSIAGYGDGRMSIITR